jgi:hypothetical protein
VRLHPGILPVVVLALACSGAPPVPAEEVRADSLAVRFPSLPDSLALTTADGHEVWFTQARRAVDSAGGPCLERGLEIRHQGTRKLVPLLMTGATPELLNDSTIRARIWLNCHPGNTYDVDLRTGRPTRVQ